MSAFEALFGLKPLALADAPGRVNLLGEHTDYNNGFVLPTVISQRTTVAVAAAPDGRMQVRSAQFPEQQSAEAPPFVRYVVGCIRALREADFKVPAVCAYIDSSVPIGKGLSSSAALEVATLRALRSAFSLSIDDVTIARIGQRAEVDHVGVNSGIMDQMAASLGSPGYMLFLDTASLESRLLAFPAGSELCVLDSGTERSLIDTPYNQRRHECEQAAEALGVTSLRQLEDVGSIVELSLPLRNRVRHVLSENARVLSAARGVSAEEFGRLMNASHTSLRDDYEVSCTSLDVLVDLLQRDPSVFGARLTGAGFGGACVALVKSGTASDVSASALAEYRRRGYRGARLA